MAARRYRGFSGNFRDDQHLKQYFLDKDKPTGKTLGVWSYGSVLEVSQMCGIM